MDKDQLKEILGEALQESVSEKVEEQTADLKEQATNNAGPAISTSKEPESNQIPKSNGIGAARFVRAMANAKGDPEKAKLFAEKTWNDDLGRHIQKALSAGDFDQGGFMVPPDFSEEIIELLRNRDVVRRANPMVMALPNGSMTIPRQTGSSSASYVGENQGVNASNVTGGQITLSAKKLMGKVAVSNELLAYDAGDAADQLIRRDLVRVLAEKEDVAFLRGDGNGGAPKGLRYWAANSTSSNGDTLSDIRQDLQDLYFDLVGNNVMMDQPALFMSEREKAALQFSVVDNEGNLVFANEISQNGTLMGWPIFTTNSLPTNLGSGSDSEIILADMSDVIIGDMGTIQLDTSSEASYADDSGSTVSAFDLDQTVVRAKLQHDLAVRHNESVSVKTGVTWGS